MNSVKSSARKCYANATSKFNVWGEDKSSFVSFVLGRCREETKQETAAVMIEITDFQSKYTLFKVWPLKFCNARQRHPSYLSFGDLLQPIGLPCSPSVWDHLRSIVFQYNDDRSYFTFGPTFLTSVLRSLWNDFQFVNHVNLFSKSSRWLHWAFCRDPKP